MWRWAVVVAFGCVVQPSNPPPQYGGGSGYAGGAPPSGGGAYGGNCGPGNLALDKAARQSSQSSWSKPNDAQGAVDGQKNGSFGFHTEAEQSPWWEVDLGGPCALGQIVISNRLDYAGRAGSLQVSVSSGDGNYQTIYTHDGSAFGGFDGKPLVVNASGRSARVVRIQLTTRDYLHLDEVEVYGDGGSAPVSQPTTQAPPSQPPAAQAYACGGGNIALGRAAQQSSLSSWSTGTGDAGGAVDGKKDGKWGFHTNNEKDPWWEVDLGRTCAIRTVRIYNRMDCCTERSKNLSILVWNGTSWDVAYRHNGTPFGGTTDNRPLSVDLGGRAGSRVRVQISGTEYMHFDEIEIESQ